MGNKAKVGIMLLGAVLTLHIGFTFIKPLVVPEKQKEKSEKLMELEKKLKS